MGADVPFRGMRFLGDVAHHGAERAGEHRTQRGRWGTHAAEAVEPQWMVPERQGVRVDGHCAVCGVLLARNGSQGASRGVPTRSNGRRSRLVLFRGVAFAILPGVRLGPGERVDDKSAVENEFQNVAEAARSTTTGNAVFALWHRTHDASFH